MRQTVIAFLLLNVASGVWGFTDTRLKCSVTPVESQRGIWDFSEQTLVDDGPVYRSYGDSLVAEYYDGVRQWYAFEGDSTFFLGSESRLMKILPNAPIPTSAFGNTILSGAYAESDTGRYCRYYRIGNKGAYRSYMPENVKITLAENDTINAMAVTETREYYQWFITDSVAPLHVTDTRIRWFVAENPLPVALSIAEARGDSTNIISYHSVTYCIEGDEIRKLKFSGDAVDKVLANSTITFHDGTLTIHGDFSADLQLSLFVTDIRGNLAYETTFITTGDNTVHEQLPPLPPGQYVATVSAGTPVNCKAIITVL